MSRRNVLCTVVACLSIVLPGLPVTAADKGPSSGTLTVDNVLVRLIEQVEVSARVAGVLESVEVQEGELVSDEQLLAQIEDSEAALSVERAQLDVQISQMKASNDVKLRFSQKSVEVAEAELQRALKSREAIADSVSQSEIDTLRLTMERTKLDVEQARHDMQVAKMTSAIKENELQFAQLDLERRQITSPIDGVVVKVFRREGEWVEPGEKVIRLLRINRLRAEGFVDSSALTDGLKQQPVKLHVRLPGGNEDSFDGKVVFVSPEIDPVNGQVRIWAEIENRNLLLRPGLHGTMTIARPRANEETATIRQ